MRIFGAFFRDIRGSAVQTFGAAAGALALASMATVYMLDRASTDGNSPLLALIKHEPVQSSDGDRFSRQLASAPRPANGVVGVRSGKVDTNPTASIPQGQMRNVLRDPRLGMPN